MYAPIAIYYEDADAVEYIRQDVASIHRRVDDFLTLLLSYDDRTPIGFRFKGFKNFYLNHFNDENKKSNIDFVQFTIILELAMSKFGDNVFDKPNKILGYKKAIEIASTDRVELRQFPQVA